MKVTSYTPISGYVCARVISGVRYMITFTHLMVDTGSGRRTDIRLCDIQIVDDKRPKTNDGHERCVETHSSYRHASCISLTDCIGNIPRTCVHKCI